MSDDGVPPEDLLLVTINQDEDFVVLWILFTTDVSTVSGPGKKDPDGTALGPGVMSCTPLQSRRGGGKRCRLYERRRVKALGN